MKKLKIILLWVADYLLTAATTMYLWNGIVSEIFGVKQINIIEAIALSFFYTYLRYSPSKESGKKDFEKMFLEDFISIAIMLFIGMVIIQFL